MKGFSEKEQKKINNIFFILCGFFITNAIIAEILGTKIFEVNLFLNFNLSVGVVIWPVVFIGTDIINEYFGKEGVKKISYFTVILISYIFLVIFISTKLKPADFWLEVNNLDSSGNYFNINYAYNAIFTQSSGIIIGSIIAFLIAQILDVHVFQKIKRITGENFIWLRATGSTLISQFIDSFLILFIAFYLLSPEDKSWSLNEVFLVGKDNYLFKFMVAILITPLIYFGHFIIDKYLGKSLAKKCKDYASSTS